MVGPWAIFLSSFFTSGFVSAFALVEAFELAALVAPLPEAEAEPLPDVLVEVFPPELAAAADELELEALVAALFVATLPF